MPKPKRGLRIQIMEAPPESDDASSTASEDSVELDEILADLKTQIRGLCRETHSLQTRLLGVFARAKEVLDEEAAPTTEELLRVPLRPREPVARWLRGRGVSLDSLTLDTLVDTIYDAATSMDLETRVATFEAKDAAVLWGGQRRMTVFQILAALPGLVA